MKEYISQLTDEEYNQLGRIIAGKPAEIKEKVELEDCFNLLYKVSTNRPIVLRKNNRAQIFKLDLDVTDFYFEGVANNLFTIKTEKVFYKYIKFMAQKFGKVYADKCFNYHKKKLNELLKVAEELEQKRDETKGNSLLVKVYDKQIAELKTSYYKQLDDIHMVLVTALVEKGYINC